MAFVLREASMLAAAAGPVQPTRERVQQRRARDLEAAAHAGLAGPAVQRRDDLLDPLRLDGERPTAFAAPTLAGLNSPTRLGLGQSSG